MRLEELALRRAVSIETAKHASVWVDTGPEPRPPPGSSRAWRPTSP